ncbi:DUF3563 family protein [Aquincola tertiaricarbonis]|uniref:DUF3563 family protein n=1 Tax=Aquincola tertiaricarbonis TaxID=391953 RepID=UPI0009FACAD8|nr:DUF3563 family protein [Aquincola tertiaricarbonis]
MTEIQAVNAPAGACERPAAAPSGTGLLSHLWRSLLQSKREAYFASATDLVDLERRQRTWERASHEPSLVTLEAWR